MTSKEKVLKAERDWKYQYEYACTHDNITLHGATVKAMLDQLYELQQSAAPPEPKNPGATHD